MWPTTRNLVIGKTGHGPCRLLGKTGTIQIIVQVSVYPWSDIGQEGKFRDFRAVDEMHVLGQGLREVSLRKRRWS